MRSSESKKTSINNKYPSEERDFVSIPSLQSYLPTNPRFMMKEEKFLEKYFDLSDRKRAFAEKRLYSVEIELVDSCQLSCKYCYNRPYSTRKQITLDTLEQLLENLRDVGIKRVFFEGGEPLLYPFLERALKLGRDLGFKNQIVTNGIGFTKEVSSSIAGLLDSVSYHLDTVNTDVFCGFQDSTNSDMVRRLHMKSLEGISNLVESGFDPADIELNIVLSKPLNGHYRDTIDWAIQKMGFGMVILLPFHPVGKAQKLPEADWLPDLELVEEAFKYRAEMVQPVLLNYGTMDLCKYYCMTNFYIDIRGDVMPCSFTPAKFGNIYEYEQDIGKLLNKHYHALAFSDCVDAEGNNLVSGPCRDCQFADDCFGCRANALHVAKEHTKSDPLCWMSRRTKDKSL